jgi:hypothetical protein
VWVVARERSPATDLSLGGVRSSRVVRRAVARRRMPRQKSVRRGLFVLLQLTGGNAGDHHAGKSYGIPPSGEGKESPVGRHRIVVVLVGRT